MIAFILSVIGLIIILLILLFLAGMFLSYHFMQTPPFKSPDGKVISDSIASLEHIRLGGVEQTILIRGRNNRNPIILFLHGGPGTSEMALIRRFNSELENHFIVVNWDQRGTGKSYNPFIPKISMNPEQFISDGHDLIELLCRRFHQDKIFLIGHSWGSYLGVNIAKRYPERIKAYVGIGQTVHFSENDKLSYQFTLDMAVKENNTRALKELRALKSFSSPGGYSFSEIGVKNKWMVYYGGAVYGQKDYHLITSSLFGPEFNLFDLFGFLAGAIGSLLVLDRLLFETCDDLMITVPELKMPVYFMEGRHDYNVPFELAEKYFNVLKAPKKELIWFENSAHMPNFEEAQKFNDLMINKILEENK